jgi:phosphoglycerate dehydrogenase-like enzyme
VIDVPRFCCGRDFIRKMKEEKMSGKHKIVFCFNPIYVPQEVIEISKRELPDAFEAIPIEKDIPKEKKLGLYEQADFLMLFSADPTPEEFEAMKKVRLIQLLSAGYNKFDIKTANRMKIPVANNHGNYVAVAEFTIMLILALLRKLPLHAATTKNGKWLEHSLMTELCEMAGRTLGLVGLGHVGREVAKRARGFDTKILYYDIQRLNPEEEKKLGVEFILFEELLEKSDIISLHLALTPQSRGLIGKKEFERMKPTVFLINTARGEIVDQKELYRVLFSRRIAGAAIDVFAREPVDPNEPLLLLDNVIATPHMAGATLDTWKRRLQIAYRNFLLVVSNQDPLHIVNPGFGRT